MAHHNSTPARVLAAPTVTPVVVSEQPGPNRRERRQQAAFAYREARKATPPHRRDKRRHWWPGHQPALNVPHEGSTQ